MKTAKLYKTTSEWKPKNMLNWETGFAFVSTGNKKLWIPSNLMEIKFDQGRLLVDLG